MGKVDIFAANGRMPTARRPDLRILFDQFNEENFDGVLVRESIELVWCTRLRVTAGMCHYKRNKYTGVLTPYKIRLADKTFANENYDEDWIYEVMNHEMVHAWTASQFNVRGHGWRFQSKMASIMQDGRGDYTYHNMDTTGLRNHRR